MKTQDIQRGIVSRHCRARGAPDIGRVSRLRDAEGSTATCRLRHRGERSVPANRKAVLVWSATLSVVTLTAIGITFFMWVVPRISPQAERVVGNPSRDTDRVRIASKFPSPSMEEALDLVRLAITNRDPERLESFFRMGAASRTEVIDFLKASERLDGPVERYEWLSSMDADGLLLEGVLVVYRNRGKPVERLAFLTPDEAGRWKMDFEAFARSIRPSWDDLLGNAVDRALVRVFVANDAYYNGPYSNDKEWICYGIASPDTEELLRGYCKIGSQQAEAMSRLLSRDRKLSRATLEIHRAKNAGPKQFEITRLVAEDWVVAGAPGSDS